VRSIRTFYYFKEKEFEGTMSKNKDIILSIGLLVSNRKDTIQKCLDSLAPIREAISTELIIIDTGCDADLHEILEKYADKLECFTWCKDFAKARNASLALATGEWFLYLDDDEWFIDSKAIIDFFQSGKYKDYGSASYIQRNYLDFEGSQYTDTWVGRMTKIEPETCFKSKIHEYIHPRTGADINLNAIVEHYGYVYKTEEDKRKHFERNFTLLKEMVAEEPDEIRWKLQLVQELRTVDAFEDMIAYGKKYLELLTACEGGYEAHAVGSFYASVILGYMGMEDYKSAKQWCDTLRADARVNKLALTLAEQISAKALFYLGDYEASITAAKQYFEYQKYFKFHRNELHLSQKVPFVGEVFDVVKIKEMYSLLICSGLKLQDVSYLSEYMHKLKWNEKHLYVFEEIADTLIEAMCTLGYRKAFYRIVKIIRAHSALNEYFYGKVEEWKENGVDVTPIENIDKWGIRKRTQKQLLEIVDSLISVNTLIKSLVEMGNKEQLEGILSEAQNVAISLGTAIENGLGLGTVAVSILEQYCEVLWSITQVTDDSERQELVTVLVDLMEKEKEEISNFPIKTVAVFMPYKASMWDSLESVWLAARDDEMCDDYVVPIPYFDLDTDRQFKKYNYEGELFPEYVPVTFYEDYDVEAEHPDMIYVHNPYDQYNTVTSVAPNYYCSKLKDYTDNLVYIPYFVLKEISPTNQSSIDGMKHFCFLPGTLFADTVILQSENMRQIYINEFERATKRQGLNIAREVLEKKFLGLGSPKIDKAINTKKEDLDIPIEWMNVIEKPDGSWKKIIFYNTSLNAFLKETNQMLEKIKDVLRIFKENQDEVALLWRPHPLMLQTIESMHPRFRNEYLKIVNEYKAEGWGIYDDTADMDRAVALSDAYYGDQSSVVELYQETGKPVMIQNTRV